MFFFFFRSWWLLWSVFFFLMLCRATFFFLIFCLTFFLFFFLFGWDLRRLLYCVSFLLCVFLVYFCSVIFLHVECLSFLLLLLFSYVWFYNSVDSHAEYLILIVCDWNNLCRFSASVACIFSYFSKMLRIIKFNFF